MVSLRAAEQIHDRLEKVDKWIESRLKGDDYDGLSEFAQHFYNRTTAEDLAEQSAEYLYGIALSMWKFLGRRKPGTAILRVYNPKPEEHGWKSGHTIVEIVTEDMPFLFDSITGWLSHAGYRIHLAIHPVVGTKRDKAGRRKGYLRDRATKKWGKDDYRESIMHLQINEQTDPDTLKVIADEIAAVLDDVRAATEDWPTMLERAQELVEEYADAKGGSAADDRTELHEFLTWLSADHFTFLGCRDYVYDKKQAKISFHLDVDSGLGILRDAKRQLLTRSNEPGLAPIVQQFIEGSELALITKTGVRGRVHRQVHMDTISIKRHDKKGNLTGERRMVGLFTSAAYNSSARDIPILRRKVISCLTRAGFDPAGHDGKALVHVLETFPRDEIFQIDTDELYDMVSGILAIQERPIIKMFARKDPFGRFYSCIIYVPRERHSTALRRAFEKILIEDMRGRISNYYTQISDSILARIHIVVGIEPDAPPIEVDYERIETKLIEAARSWEDNLRDALTEKWGEGKGLSLAETYCDGFPTAYMEDFSTDLALSDIDNMTLVHDGAGVALNFYRLIEDENDTVRFKIYHPETAVALSDCLPMLENMGFRVIGETPFLIEPKGRQAIWLQDFEMETLEGTAIDLGELKAKLEAVFEKVWRREVENDRFNRLVTRAGLDWREVVILRAYCKYLRQAAITYSQFYIEQTLAAHPTITRLLVQLFNARFDLAVDGKRDKKTARIERKIQTALDDVSSLDEDRIIRRYLNLVQSTLRTNYFQADSAGALKPYLSFKLDSQQVSELPLPRPYREIFVYSPRVEGVHLRGGPVARGGLRWSDRPEDFRTEVLGLMKAQMVKNAVIVPVGSKGGFVPKLLPPPSEREAFMAEGVECYKTFLRGLLDITDNLAGKDIVNPEQVVRHDGDDPYLVVAADKGTATFSDIANGVAGEYGFWLGDAFASGGAKGYDHKVMGITARGAWESVKRHFRELGRDIQSEDFTVIGIGDMSGDVFGNGMLLSKHIRLLAAFDHRDIFIDPNPDTAKSFKERERLFKTPRTSWQDYDKKLISKGGGVVSRSQKSIKLTPEMKAVSGLEANEATPFELMHALLKADADLLWFGGIGTYVKAEDESQAEAGDRANDALRVNGRELKALVIGEGGNLGMTQLGRIEFARNGGRCNSDAIDNSAGVDCSDHEVNIKILVDAIVADGEMTSKQRDRLLADMTDDVASHVLIDNYLQTQAVTVAQSQAAARLPLQARFMRDLERAGQLDRVIEFLPDDEQITEMIAAEQGLARPELSVLIAYAKMVLYDSLLASDVSESAALVKDLVNYFPPALRDNHGETILAHRLRREIIATVTANSMVNRLGITFVNEMMEETGLAAGDIARAYVSAREAFAFRSLWRQIEALDNKVPAAVQAEMILHTSLLHRAATLWFLRNLAVPHSISKTLEAFAAGIAELRDCLGDMLGDVDAKVLAAKSKEYEDRGVPRKLAQEVAALDPLASACDIVHVANSSGSKVADVAQTYFTLGARLGLDWLRNEAEELSPADTWERSAVNALVSDFFSHQRALTASILGNGKARKKDGLVDKWVSANEGAIARNQSLVEELKGEGTMDIARLTLALHSLGRLRG